jgi:hypothetical protein
MKGATRLSFLTFCGRKRTCIPRGVFARDRKIILSVFVKSNGTSKTNQKRGKGGGELFVDGRGNPPLASQNHKSFFLDPMRFNDKRVIQF